MSKPKYGPPWTREAVAKEAKRFKTRSEFKENAVGAYTAARYRYHNIEKVCSHMAPGAGPSRYWTRERVAEEAKRYKTRNEFRREAPGAYHAAREYYKNIKEVCAHMVSGRGQNRHWTRQRVKDAVGKCETLRDFRHEYPGAYSALLKNRWHDFLADLSREIAYPIRWTPEAVAAEAKKYRTRTEFQKKAYGAYEAALRRHKNIDEVCAHMVNGRLLHRYWTREHIKGIADKCGTLKEFRNNHHEAYHAVCNYGWQDLLENLARASMPPGWWTIDRVSAEAKKYRTRTDFMKGSSAAYGAAHKNGWLEIACAHMELQQRPTGYWTRQRVVAEAKQYSSRTDFQKSSGGAYAVAFRKGFLDEACAHMEKKGSQYERAIYAYEFEDHSVYVGLTFDYDTRHNEHRTQNTRISKKLGKVPARRRPFNKWFSLEEAGKEESRIIQSYRKRGWKILNRAKPGGVGSQPRKWTFEKIEALAKKYKTVKGFTKNNSSAYAVACKHGWWKEVSGHMTRAVEHGKWTAESIAAESRKYSSRRDFMRKSPGAYGAACKKGLLDQVCQHMEMLVKPPGYWTKEMVLQEARNYRTRAEFHRASGGAYTKASKEGWLESACAHMDEVRKPSGYWTFEQIKKEAKKYKTRVEFMKRAVSAYNRASKNGWLDDVCIHMEILRKPNGYWTRKTILSESAKYETLKAFRDSPGGAYDAAYDLGLVPELHRRMKMHKKPNDYWTLERIKSEAKKYKHRKDFHKGSGGAYALACKNGWLDEVCLHMTLLKKPNGYWTPERVFAEAARVDTLKEFRDLPGGGYTAALKLGLMSELRDRLEGEMKPRGYWMYERIAKEAKKYKRRSDFNRGSPSAYSAAYKAGWLDEICAHMPPAKNKRSGALSPAV